MNTASSYFKKIVVPLQKGPMTVVINETGYGFGITECDDASAIIRVDSETADSYSLAGLRKVAFPQQFKKLYLTYYSDMTSVKDANVTLIIMKDKNLEMDPITGFREVSNALFFAQLFMLMASGNTTRYKIWTVDASLATPSIFTDSNQIYFPNIPMIQSISVLGLASGSAFTLATTALQDLQSLDQSVQDPISSEFLQVGTSLPIMGYSLVYTPTVTASGTQTFLIQLQQPLSVSQLKIFQNL